MNTQQLELTRLIGKKEFSNGGIIQIISLSDFHRWMNEKKLAWFQTDDEIVYGKDFDMCDCGKLGKYGRDIVKYDSSKDLLDQSSETLKQIIELITYNQS